MLSCYLFGTWIGYLLRTLLGQEQSGVGRKAYGVIFGVLVLVVLVLLMGLSGNSVGPLVVASTFGFYYTLGFNEQRMTKLSKSWAGVWMLILLISVEYGRTLLITSILTN